MQTSPLWLALPVLSLCSVLSPWLWLFRYTDDRKNTDMDLCKDTTLSGPNLGPELQIHIFTFFKCRAGHFYIGVSVVRKQNNIQTKHLLFP